MLYNLGLLLFLCYIKGLDSLKKFNNTSLGNYDINLQISDVTVYRSTELVENKSVDNLAVIRQFLTEICFAK